MHQEPFSARYGYAEQRELILEDAPEQVREGLREILCEYGFTSPSDQRAVICRALRVRPDPANWSEYPNVEHEVGSLIHGVQWFRFYDMVQRIAQDIGDQVEDAETGKTWFETLFNNLLSEERVGYRMVDGVIEKTGSQEFDDAVAGAVATLQDPGLLEPLTQLKKAVGFRNDLPPDYANAVKEAVNAVEGVFQVVTDKQGVALPTILSGLTPPLPSGLKKLYDGLYGYGSGSQGARHAAVGGHVAKGEEAEFIIHAAAAAIAYAVSIYGSGYYVDD